MFLIFLLNAGWALAFTLGKDCLSYMPPITFIGVRMMIAGTALLAYAYFREKKQLTFSPQHALWFAGLVLFQIYIAFIGEFIGLSLLSASKVSLLFNLTPFITAIICYFFFKEVFTPKKIAGLTIGFIGLLPILYNPTDAGSLFTISFGDIVTLISVVSAALGWIFLQKVTRDLGYSYFFANGFAMLVGGILAFITSFFMESRPDYYAAFTSFTFLRSFIMLMLIGNVMCFNLYGYLLKHYTPTIISFFGFFIPLFSAFFDWIFFGVSVNTNFYVSVAIVTLGLYLYYQEELKQGYIVKA